MVISIETYTSPWLLHHIAITLSKFTKRNRCPHLHHYHQWVLLWIYSHISLWSKSLHLGHSVIYTEALPPNLYCTLHVLHTNEVPRWLNFHEYRVKRICIYVIFDSSSSKFSNLLILTSECFNWEQIDLVMACSKQCPSPGTGALVNYVNISTQKSLLTYCLKT